MVITGFVVGCEPDHVAESVIEIEALAETEVYGSDERGNVVVEAESSMATEKVVERMERLPHVLSVGLTYMNMEDEAEQIAAGALKPKPFLKRAKSAKLDGTL